jgi:uncharacterized protein
LNRTGNSHESLSARAALALLSIYKRVLAPALHAGVPGACCFQPTCSEYAAIALAEHGPLRGGLMAMGRLLRCNPFNRGGFDPVPAKAASGVRRSLFSRNDEHGSFCGWTESQIPGNR